MPAREPVPQRAHAPSVRLNPKGNARNRSHTMSDQMWADCDAGAAKLGVPYGEFARRALSSFLWTLDFAGYSEDGTVYPASKRPES